MTPCEELGYKVGDEFVVTENTTFPKGARVRLSCDDKTSNPRFKGIGYKAEDGEDWHYIHLSLVNKVSGDSMITRINGLPFATEASAHQQLTTRGLQGTHEVVPHGGGYALAPKRQVGEPEQDTTPNPIATLLTARKARDEAEVAYQAALEVMRNELPGYALTEVGNDALPVDGEDMTDPVNWRAGDWVECVEPGCDLTVGKIYTVEKVLGSTDIRLVCDDNDDHPVRMPQKFRFHHRHA